MTQGGGAVTNWRTEDAMNTVLTLGTRTPPEDRVRAQTSPEINRQFDMDLERRIRFYATQDEQTISERIRELDREWDIERALETNAASVSLLGLLLGAIVDRKWFVLPMLVSGFLLQHAVQGWCPPLPVLRRMGVRTRLEIEQERHALKALRGDYDGVHREESGATRHAEQLARAARP
jgi:hypothetical protein